MPNKQPVKNELFCFNKQMVGKIKKQLPKQEAIDKLSDVFSALGDQTRLKILYAISKEELCVCDISHVLGMSLSAVSHQLRVLRNLGLVKFVNRGKMTFYSLPNGFVSKIIKENK